MRKTAVRWSWAVDRVLAIGGDFGSFGDAVAPLAATDRARDSQDGLISKGSTLITQDQGADWSIGLVNSIELT